MDSREQRADAGAASWIGHLALLATLTFGFRDFPQHSGLIASAAILVHVAAEGASAQSRLAGRQREITAWLETLTLRIGLIDLAHRIVDKDPPQPFGPYDDPEFEYWRQHQRAAVEDIKRDQEVHRDTERFGFATEPSIWLSFLAHIVFYGVILCVAALVATI